MAATVLRTVGEDGKDFTSKLLATVEPSKYIPPIKDPSTTLLGVPLHKFLNPPLLCDVRVLIFEEMGTGSSDKAAFTLRFSNGHPSVTSLKTLRALPYASVVRGFTFTATTTQTAG